MKNIGIISDTHGYVDDRILHYLAKSDEIWHAGDIGDPGVISSLETIAPVRAVYGNIDGGSLRQVYPLDAVFQTGGLQVYITHIAGTPGRYPARVAQKIREVKPAVFVCGHSHICVVKQNPAFGLLHINPGAAGMHGFHKVRTLIRMTIDSGTIGKLEVVELGPRSRT